MSLGNATVAFALLSLCGLMQLAGGRNMIGKRSPDSLQAAMGKSYVFVGWWSTAIGTVATLFFGVLFLIDKSGLVRQPAEDLEMSTWVLLLLGLVAVVGFVVRKIGEIVEAGRPLGSFSASIGACCVSAGQGATTIGTAGFAVVLLVVLAATGTGRLIE